MGKMPEAQNFLIPPRTFELAFELDCSVSICVAYLGHVYDHILQPRVKRLHHDLLCKLHGFATFKKT